MHSTLSDPQSSPNGLLVLPSEQQAETVFDRFPEKIQRLTPTPISHLQSPRMKGPSKTKP